MVILEPDALPDLLGDCAAELPSRLRLLSEAVAVLKANANTFVYIDAGNADWESAQDMYPLLQQAGITGADGFALNVSNFVTTDDSIAYGRQLSALLGGKHFVIDTSRNGRGTAPDVEWCNPPGRGLGARPTARTADPLCDAYLWIKSPGESDGECNGGPKAGVWWPEYALSLAQLSVP